MGVARFITNVAFDLLEDRARLTSLKRRYEQARLFRRACLMTAAAVLVLAAYALLQVAIIWEWMKVWNSVAGVALALAAINAGVAALLAWGSVRKTRRNDSFQRVEAEWGDTLASIRGLFS